MENISLLQQASLVVGSSFIFAKGMQSISNHYLIRKVSFAVNVAGLIMGVTAIAISILGSMLTSSSYSKKNTIKTNPNYQFSLWLKDGTVLACLSGVGVVLI